MTLLSQIRGPEDVKRLPRKDLKILAQEIRTTLVEVTDKNGGHLASNLGVVELTLALHRVFYSPRDKIIFDVSHQSYVHKLLTGRNGDDFDHLRQDGGCSGFSSPEESPHDAYVAGHAGTALSVALGWAYARDHGMKNIGDVVAVVGDGALTCGETLEALNNISKTTQKIIVILNDNDYSIDKNVGALALYLNHIMRSRCYQMITKGIKRLLGNGRFGHAIIGQVRTLKKAIKGLVLPSSFFECYGLRYFGPFNGHNLDHLIEVLTFAQKSTRPVLLHIKTEKGRGYSEAVRAPDRFHGVEPHYRKGGSLPWRMSDVVGYVLNKMAEQDKRVIGITAAMAYGTGLWRLRDEHPGQFVDVGIAESHAVTFAGALAASGMRPFCAIYSSFLQRGFDQLIHDVGLPCLPVTFCVDRAGLSPRDGPTHHGMFDLSYLRLVPNAVIMQPATAKELVQMLTAAADYTCPVFIRYANEVIAEHSSDIEKYLKYSPKMALGASEEVVSGEDVALLALGPWVRRAVEVAKQLKEAYQIDAGVVNMRWVKPVDQKMVEECSRKYRILVTLESNTEIGGLGSAVLETINLRRLQTHVLRLAFPDAFLPHASTEYSLLKRVHMDNESMIRRIVSYREDCSK